MLELAVVLITNPLVQWHSAFDRLKYVAPRVDLHQESVRIIQWAWFYIAPWTHVRAMFGLRPIASGEPPSSYRDTIVVGTQAASEGFP